MCTVTYVPTNNGGFILTSNRDEQPSRSAKKLYKDQINQQEIIFPKDAKAGGTWIAISSGDKVVCLLNGAFEKHHHQPPYRLSRGIMVLDFFKFPNSKAFYKEYEFMGMEPFTMIVFDQGQLSELRWNEKKLHYSPLKPDEFYIWSSATLYDKKAKLKREQWFEAWKNQTNEFDQTSILDFHHRAGDGDPENDVIMNRKGIVQTVSITSIKKTQNRLDLFYLDLLSNSRAQENIKVSTASDLLQ